MEYHGNNIWSNPPMALAWGALVKLRLGEANELPLKLYGHSEKKFYFANALKFRLTIHGPAEKST